MNAGVYVGGARIAEFGLNGAVNFNDGSFSV